jgi:hypothetical protein
VNVTEPVGVPAVPVTVALSVAEVPVTVGVVARLAEGGEPPPPPPGGVVTVTTSDPQALDALLLLESPL